MKGKAKIPALFFVVWVIVSTGAWQTTCAEAANGPYASNPDPADGAEIYGELYPEYPPQTHIWTMLIFEPGSTAVKHTGYFSEDYSKVYDRVEDANLGPPPLEHVPGREYTYFAGNPMFPPAVDTLVRGTTYYWCVDETDAMGTTYPGDVWEFTVMSYYATRPNPPNEAININPDVLLSWQPGYSEGILAHDVYIGTSWDLVFNADEFDITGIYQGWVIEPNWPCSGLPTDTKIYWRVDEAHDRFFPGTGTIYKGNVWSFTTVIPVGETYYVDGVNGDNSNDGLTPETAFATIQKGVDTALNGDTVLVADGTYTGDGNRDIDFRGKAITVRSADPGDPNTVAMTIIECGGSEGENHRGFYFHSGENSNSILDGFTIINGYVYGSPDWLQGCGGAISCNRSNPTIRNCVLRDNYADPWGGGIGLERCSPRIENCTITGNYSDSGGGGIRCGNDCSPTIVNCRIIGNTARAFGGGIDMPEEGSPIIRGCVISNNSGGAIRCRDSSPLIENCIFAGNGPFVIAVVHHSRPIINNCTIVHNTGPAIENSSGGSPTITNCILWGNYAVARTADITYSNVEGGWQGQGNISIDPQFVNAAADDYHLQPLSPCIDAGDNSVVTVTTDLDGNPRIRGKAVDMGAYESLYYHVDGVNGDNTNDGFTRETAFETIQFAIDEVNDSDTILVWPGVYNEAATHGINFKGKAITVKSAADAAVLEVPGFAAVSFVLGEDGNSVLSNFVVRGSTTGIFALFANPTINNVTVVGNNNGVIADNANPNITNSIFWNNINGDLFGSPDPITAQYSFVQEEIEDGLISHWKFDEGSGTIAYDSAGTNDGTTYGAAWMSGQIGGALDFDGMFDYVDIPYNSSLDIDASEGITLSVWIKLDSYPGGFNQGPIFGLFDSTGEGSKNYLMISETNYGNLITWDHAPPSFGWIDSIKPDLDKWYHVTVVEDSTYRAIYINGELDVSDNITELYQGNTPDRIRIGNRADGILMIYFYFDGTIDDVSIYNRALSAEEIELKYKAGLAGLGYNEPGFVDANGGDYHLLSERGRYRATTDEWILDDVTSPCIDGGDPSVKPSNERMPNGGRVSMGAYGNTAYASMSEWPIKGDVNNDGRFNFVDIAILLDGWLEELGWAE